MLAILNPFTWNFYCIFPSQLAPEDIVGFSGGYISDDSLAMSQYLFLKMSSAHPPVHVDVAVHKIESVANIPSASRYWGFELLFGCAPSRFWQLSVIIIIPTPLSLVTCQSSQDSCLISFAWRLSPGPAPFDTGSSPLCLTSSNPPNVPSTNGETWRINRQGSAIALRMPS
jgi:hypothetical protein